MNDSKGNWMPCVYICPDCKDTMSSSYPGEFVRCKCGASAVDETEDYTRTLGKAYFIGRNVDKGNEK